MAPTRHGVIARGAAGRLTGVRVGGDGCFEGVDLVALMFEEAGEDLFEGALPVAEPEAVLRWDRVQLSVGQRGDPAERVAGCCELLEHGAWVEGVCRVVLVVAGDRALVVFCGSMADGAQEARDAMGPGPGVFVSACHSITGLHERRDPLVVVRGVAHGRTDGAVAELLPAGAR